MIDETLRYLKAIRMQYNTTALPPDYDGNDNLISRLGRNVVQASEATRDGVSNFDSVRYAIAMRFRLGRFKKEYDTIEDSLPLSETGNDTGADLSIK